MSNDNNPSEVSESEERALQAIFDETASPPETAALQRMARAAAQIPDTAEPWYQRLWSRPFAIGAAVAGAAALALVLTIGDTPPPDPLTENVTTAVTTAPEQTNAPDETLDELLAFELTDNGEEELASLDPDPLATWDGDDAYYTEDHPVSALDLLFLDDGDDVELLGSAFDDYLTEGG